MWLTNSLVGASVFMMCICKLEAKPQTDVNNLSDSALISGLLGGGNDVCKCVPLKSCCGLPPNGDNPIPDVPTNNNGAPILDGFVDIRTFPINIGDRSSTTCPDILSICCNIECEKTTVPVPTPSPPSNGPSNECGIRNLNGIGVTVNGFEDQQSQLGEFPWMVAVLDHANTYVGGGSLVHPKIILTAAHKIHEKVASSLVARIGDWDLSTTNEPIPNQNINVVKILVHPSFDRATLVNNVALLILERRANLGDTVMPVCLPESGQVFDGSNCVVTGWGKDVFGATGRFQKIMKKVSVPAVSQNECQNMLRKTRLGSDFNLHKTFNCAGGKGEDACEGDGGSPLVCPNPNNPNEYVQMGVVAWGIGCGQVGHPGVYGSIPQTVDWIRQNIQAEGSAGFDIRTGQ